MDLTVRKAPLNLMQATAKFRVDGINTLIGLHRDYGDFVSMNALPGMKNYLLFSPEVAHDILVTNAAQFRKPTLAKRMFETSFGNGLFFSEGDFWRRQRKLAQPAFHHARIRIYAEDMVRHTQRLLERWQHGGIIDLDKEMHALTLTIVVNALFKTDVSGLTDQVGEAMKELGDTTLIQMTSPIHVMMPAWVPTNINRRKQHAVDTINRIIFQLIAEHRKSGKDTGDLLSVFITARDEDTGEYMSDAQIRDELMTMFIAGHETSAVGLAWALLEISRNPEIERKLHAEVDGVLQGRVPSLEDLPNLPFTQKIVKETLRLYPPAIFISRQPLEPKEIGDARIRTSDLINIVTIAIHRDPRWYSDPDRFDPDRFTAEFEKSLPKCTYMPFGTGPRICIGNGFAMLEMQLVLATLAQCFRFVAAPGTEPVKPSFNITLGFHDPLRMELVARG
jgi:cytochrome P450